MQFWQVALTTFFVTPTLADYYIVQEPTTKRCRIVEERPAPGVGVVIGGIELACAPKRKAECAPNAERRPAAMSLLRSVNVARRDDVRRSRLDTAGLAPEWRHEVRFG